MAANDDLLRGQIEHQVYLQRYSKNVVGKILSLLDKSERQARKDLTSRLEKITERGSDLGPTTTKRLNKLVDSLGVIRADAYKRMHQTLKGELVDFAGYESVFQTQAIESAIGIGVAASAPTLTQLKNIATRQPFRGRLLKEWVSDLSAADKKRFKDAISIGMVEGLGPRQIASRVTKGLGVSRHQAEAITRTAVNHVANATFTEVGKANEDLVKGRQWLATLDGRTSLICIDLDGKVFKLGGRAPPAHIQCRSTMTYVLKSWKQAGIERENTTPEFRASMNGLVPGKVKYKEWLKTRSPDFQDEVLGKSRGALFRDGDLSVASRFTDASGRSYTLDQLKKRENTAWTRAFVDPNVPRGMEFVSRDKAIDFVREKGKLTGTEHAAAFNSNGDPVVIKQGAERSVSFNGAEMKRLIAADGVEMVHNHPSATTLSGADLKFAVSAKLDKITAVGTRESSEFVSVPKTSNVTALGRAIDAAETVVMQNLKLAIVEGRITVDTASDIHFHIVNRALNDARFIEYTVVKANKALVGAQKLVDTGFVEKIVKEAAEEAKQWL
jgi:SPP1 gp7 family putative phage head morphogenesis protein